MHTACYRGFYTTYEPTEDALVLRGLTLREEDGNYQPIEGVEPVAADYDGVCSGLDMVVPFTGEMRLAKDFIQELYIHMGYLKASACRTVLDITPASGRCSRSWIVRRR
jgi:hypothetical protein